MRPRTLLVLLAVVLAVGAFIAFYERDLPGSEERGEQEKRVLPGLVAAEVTALTIEQGGEAVALARVTPGDAGGGDADGGGADEADGDGEGALGGEWRLTAPAGLAGARADGAAVEGLLGTLAALEKTRTLEDYDPADLGLDAPRARVVLEGPDGGPIRLAVGSDLPASSDLVLAREGAGAFVVDRSILRDLTRAPGDWRSRNLFPGHREAVRRVTLRGDGPEVVLERGDDAFRMVRPVADAADTAAVERLLTDLVELSAERFVDDPATSLAELGLEPPRGKVTVEGAGDPVVVALGAPAAEEGGLYLRVGGQTAVAATGLAEALERPAAQWQSRDLLPFELYRVDIVEATGAGQPLRLERSGTDWRRGDETIPYTPVSDLLFALSEARAEEVVPRASLALGEPTLTLRVTAGAADDEGAQETVLRLFAPREGRVPATVEGRDFALLLPIAAADGVGAELERVREAEPVAAAPGDEVPAGIEVEREEGP